MKPNNLLYGLDDKPSLLINLFLGLQHVTIISIGVVFPLLLVKEMGGSIEQATFVISMSMLAGGVGVIVQGLNKGPVGSGYLCPQVCGPSFLTASIMCVKTGGLSLLFGMTALAGIVEILFSRVIHKLRVLFPAEVTGLIVSMVGITVIKIASTNFLGLDESNLINSNQLKVGIGTLSLMVGLNVWTRGKIKLFCILIGMIGGYVLALAFGELTFSQIADAMDRPLVWFPFAYHPGWSFDISLLLPVSIAVICSSLKSVGDLTTCQKINDSEWKRPDMKNIQKGILADGIGCLAAGIFGGYGQSTSSTNIGLTIATGTTSRIISLSTGLILIVLGFCPKLAGIFAVMPSPVIGAVLIFALGFMVVAGFQIVMSRMIDSRKTFVIGLSIIFGLTVDLLPEAFINLHPWLKAIFSSSLSAATISAIILNLIFRIGIKSHASLKIPAHADYGRTVETFMVTQGGAWAARPEIIKKATAAITEYIQALGSNPPDISLKVSFDEHNLDATIKHSSPPPKIRKSAPTPEVFLEDGGVELMASFLVHSWSDKVKIKPYGSGTKTKLHFDH